MSQIGPSTNPVPVHSDPGLQVRFPITGPWTWYMLELLKRSYKICFKWRMIAKIIPKIIRTSLVILKTRR